MTAAALAFLAGILSILSPCVLPLLPIVLGSAASEHRYGPIALGGGVALSFVGIGLFVATVGFGIGLDGTAFRFVAAIGMTAVGTLLLMPGLQMQFAAAAAPVGNWAQQQFGMSKPTGGGAGRQFGIGLLLGAVWSPCVGPTLGAASVLAAQGEDLPQVALVMLSFGLGAALPLGIVGTMSRAALMRWRGNMIATGERLKLFLGVMLVAFGLLILSGLDKRLETALVDLSPQWLTNLTTRF
jgi:cytochrome c biogenesis protein CcdA